MWSTIIASILDFMENLGNLTNWLFKPLWGNYSELPFGILLLEKLGVDISWSYNLSPAYIVIGGLIFFLGAVLLFKIISTFWPFS